MINVHPLIPFVKVNTDGVTQELTSTTLMGLYIFLENIE